jgi:FAD/FMN-containing dehydrogenase
VLVNDVHSCLNPTRVADVARPRSAAEVQTLVARAACRGQRLSVAGGRHAMGGQQFGEDTLLVDTTALKRVLGLDTRRGLARVEAGIQWPELIAELHRLQAGAAAPWTIVQKQTGADALTLGGAVAANIHGRGLRLAPFVQDIESLELVDAQGRLLSCSRTGNPELFALAVGGYGLFGVVTAVTLRLMPRTRVRRVVEILSAEQLMPAFESRIADGYLYGDFQYSIDVSSPTFLREGVFSCYRPVDDDEGAGSEPAAAHRRLSPQDWLDLLYLAHTDKRAAYQAYARYYLSTNGQLYWSDTHQLSQYVGSYSDEINRRLAGRAPGTLMITEIYVPRERLLVFLDAARDYLRQENADLIYGTIRLIERDRDSFLAWAREPWACVIFNLRVTHTEPGLDHARRVFRGLIDLAIAQGGSYYLTYHRWATPRQVDACHPRFRDFLALKRRYDPHERFTSEWYQHYARAMHA